MTVKESRVFHVLISSGAVKHTDVLLLVFSALLILLIALSKLWSLAIAYAALVFSASLLSPVMGAALWFIPVPFEAVAVTQEAIGPYIFITPAYLSGSVFHFMNRSFMKLSSPLLIYAATFIIVVGLGAVHGGGWSEFRGLLSVIALVAVVVTALTAISNEPHRSQLVVIAALLSALTAIIYSVLLFRGGWRLTMSPDWGGGARALDGSIGIALACCMLLMFAQTRLKNSVGQPIVSLLKGRVLSMLSIVLALSLLATVSRGAILAIFVAILVTVLLFAIRALYTRAIPSQVLIVSFGLGVVVLLAPFIDQILTNGQLLTRIRAAMMDYGANTRWSIWSAGVDSLSPLEWLIGSGVGSFKELTSWAPHSIYVGILVEAGIIALTVVGVGLIMLLYRGIRTCGLPFVAFFTYVILAFATKGSLFDKYFYFAIILASSLITTLAAASLSDLSWIKWRTVTVHDTPRVTVA